ncbi:MOSC domain-containing protein [Litoreibacter halocynthiae]|uniref:MOSC domain-containing protein n=1 Tax=Litoreibacter halocynthiae TaxID=1242689 RepID=UPI0024900686|nr:MOSC domain-containing protein [Litoreibacter halocynthiae]
MTVRIDGLFFGKVAQRWDGRDPSAIGKIPVTGYHEINEFGFVSDEQADLKNHGGHDKAIHHYATDHYADWIAEGEVPDGTKPATFGENIASFGMTEKMLCIGDTLRLGTAVVQVSQGRQPCWKVSAHTTNKNMAYLFQKTGRTGWYYRVLESGIAGVGDTVSLLDRTQPDWTVERVTTARLTRRVSEADAIILAVMPELADGWRSAFSKMANGDFGENTSHRLTGEKPE